MGYTTDFYRHINIVPAPTEEFKAYINKFASVRHMVRDVDVLKQEYPNYQNQCFNSDLGVEGQYFIGGTDYDDASILDVNRSPDGVPGLWCQWIINNDNQLIWDGGEKFYNYVEWLEYLIANFFEPKGYQLNGEIYWRGEEFSDSGVITVNNNDVTVSYL